ncbi:hypothetical protein PUR49_00525, partial [Streptomyces sp. BE147]|nr:hypothetical protein [Streptomyces sp. BE147]
MTPTGDGALFDFDPQAVAPDINAPTTNPPGTTTAEPTAPPPVPAQGGTSQLQEHVSPAGLMPDTLTDRGNAKLFVKLY